MTDLQEIRNINASYDELIESSDTIAYMLDICVSPKYASFVDINSARFFGLPDSDIKARHRVHHIALTLKNIISQADRLAEKNNSIAKIDLMQRHYSTLSRYMRWQNRTLRDVSVHFELPQHEMDLFAIPDTHSKAVGTSLDDLNKQLSFKRSLLRSADGDEKAFILSEIDSIELKISVLTK